MTTQLRPGEMVRITGSFTNAAGAPADPTTVRLRVKAGSSPEELVTVEADAVGEYHGDYIVPFNGPAFPLRYRWEAEGAVVAALEGTIDVRTDWTALP